MDLRFKEMNCPSCKSEQSMAGAGAQIGGRVDLVQIKCKNCQQAFLIIPMNPELQYSVSATTEDERKEMAITAAEEKSELALAKKIIEIRACPM